MGVKGDPLHWHQSNVLMNASILERERKSFGGESRERVSVCLIVSQLAGERNFREKERETTNQEVI